jgi:hypothetical protein
MNVYVMSGLARWLMRRVEIGCSLAMFPEQKYLDESMARLKSSMISSVGVAPFFE